MEAASQIKSKADTMAQNFGDMGHKAVDQAQKKFSELSGTAADYYESGKDKAAEMQDSMETYVRDQPMKAIMIALGAGLLIGFLVSRK